MLPYSRGSDVGVLSLTRVVLLGAADPVDADAGFLAESGRENGGVVLDVQQVDELMFERSHLLPGETALRGREVQRIDRCVDHGIAEPPVFQEVGTGAAFGYLGANT